MRYENIKTGRFISRPNRFIANIEIDGQAEVCHVKNTGRCKELLVPGAKVILEESHNPSRKTKFDLVSVYKGRRLINMDSQAPNILFGEYLKTGAPFGKARLVKPETRYKNSRFDFYVETEKEKIFTEVKGVTLEKGGIVLFPDAPTERGEKHLRELADAAENGYRAAVVFVVQMSGVKYFTPNRATDPNFSAALAFAAEKGVEIYAFDCLVAENEVKIRNSVEIRL